jgi:hypothetical protein
MLYQQVDSTGKVVTLHPNYGSVKAVSVRNILIDGVGGASTERKKLSDEEQAELEQLEAEIQDCLDRYGFNLGRKLKIIRDKRLYRQNHDTFDDYCKKRWDFGARNATYKISAVEVYDNLAAHYNGQNYQNRKNFSDFVLPANTSQAGELADLSFAEQIIVWEYVVEKYSEKKITQKAIQRMKEKYLAETSGNQLLEHKDYKSSRKGSVNVAASMEVNSSNQTQANKSVATPAASEVSVVVGQFEQLPSDVASGLPSTQNTDHSDGELHNRTNLQVRENSDDDSAGDDQDDHTPDEIEKQEQPFAKEPVQGQLDLKIDVTPYSCFKQHNLSRSQCRAEIKEVLETTESYIKVVVCIYPYQQCA